MAKPDFVQWYLTGTGYNVSVFDADCQPVEENSFGNNPYDSTAVGVEHKIGSVKLAEMAAQTAEERAVFHGLSIGKVSRDCDSEVECYGQFDMTVCIWETDDGQVWDDAEDHGGFDRLIHSKPFPTVGDAMKDAESVFPNTSIYFEYGKPSHYVADEMAARRDKTHLLPPRGGMTACGDFHCADVTTTPEINEVTCDKCIAEHDAFCERTYGDDN